MVVVMMLKIRGVILLVMSVVVEVMLVIRVDFHGYDGG